MIIIIIIIIITMRLESTTTIQFHNDKFANPAGLVEFIREQGPAAKIQGNKIVLMGEMKSEGDRIKGAFNIARDLAEKAKVAKVN